MEIIKYRKDANSPWQDIAGIVGAQGAKGNPGEDYVLTDEDKKEIAAMAGGGAESYVLKANTEEFTEEDIAFLEDYWKYYLENNELKPVTIYIRSSWSGELKLVTEISANNAEYDRWLRFMFTEVYGLREWGICAHFKEDGSLDYSYYEEGGYYEIPSPKDWYWEDVLNKNYIDMSYYPYTHLKIVGYWNGNTNNVATYEISATNNNFISDEDGTKYYVAEPRAEEGLAYFNNYEGKLYFNDSYGENLCNKGFTFLGYYYWQ